MRNDGIKDEIYEIKKWENEIKRKDLKYEKYETNIILLSTIWNNKSFGDSIYTGKISINAAEMNQTNTFDNIADFSKKSKPKPKEDKDTN